MPLTRVLHAALAAHRTRIGAEGQACRFWRRSASWLIARTSLSSCAGKPGEVWRPGSLRHTSCPGVCANAAERRGGPPSICGLILSRRRHNRPVGCPADAPASAG